MSEQEPPPGAVWDGQKWVMPTAAPPGSTWDGQRWVYPKPPVKGATWDGTAWVPPQLTWMEKNQTPCCLMLVLAVPLLILGGCAIFGLASFGNNMRDQFDRATPTPAVSANR